MATLWIVDRGSPAAAFSLLPPDSAQNIIVFNERGTMFAQTIAAVRQRVHSPVSLVRIVSHGNSGRLTLVNGNIDEGNVQAFQFLRGVVRTHLAGVPGIELHGCGVASDFLPPPRVRNDLGFQVADYGNMQGQMAGWGYSGEAGAGSAFRSARGVRFLQAMANVCGICVIGAVDYQLPDARWQYEGPTIAVRPGHQQLRLTDPTNRFGLGQTVSL